MALFSNTKSNKIFWGIGIFCVAIFLFLVGFGYYQQWKGEKQVEKLANALKQMKEEIYNKKAADTIGGKTPQETLDLFIAAVEKGDYELASKYFVIEKQEQWKEDLSTAKNVDELLYDLKNAQKSEGSYSMDEKSYVIRRPILVSFALYPFGNWKIEEI